MPIDIPLQVDEADDEEVRVALSVQPNQAHLEHDIIRYVIIFIYNYKIIKAAITITTRRRMPEEQLRCQTSQKDQAIAPTSLRHSSRQSRLQRS
jgi:hypothetical protein